MPPDHASKPRRLDGYIRVSRRLGREGPGYISPDVQREAIQRWADYRGVEIAKWFVDEDESGGTQDRPGLRAIVERIESGETDGIAVWRLNRFARNVSGAIQDVERIQAAGGVLASIEEDIDPTGPFGSFILTVLLAVASLERDNLVAGWKTAKGRAVDRGAKISRTPFGYGRRPDGGIEPDPDSAPIVLEAFTRAAQVGIDAAVDYLKESAPERTWSTFTVRRTLANRCYLGESIYGELVNADAHEPIVARGTFEAAQHEAPADRRRRPAAAYPLSGVARCAACGERMVGCRGGRAPDGSGLRVYRCRASLARFKGQRCGAPTNVTADRLERYVIDQVAAALDQDPPVVEVGEPATGDLVVIEAELARLEADLAAFAADTTARGLLGEATYHGAMSARVEAIAQARLALRKIVARAESREIVLDADELRSLAPQELGEVLRGGIDAIVVARGRGPLEGRVWVIPKGYDALTR